jgi:DNA mismatch repair protein MutH
MVRMERSEAVKRLKALEGQVLQDLADRYNVTIYSSDGYVNKGWAGHVFENFLGLPINSLQSPDFGTWELKSIPLKRLKNNELSFKETMAITMINPEEVKKTPFEDSHLLSKLQKLIVIARTVGDNVDEPSVIHSVNLFDLSGELYLDVKNDYNLVRDTLLNTNLGFDALTGSMGKYIQPRTKGAGHGSTSRAFYARPLFLKQFIKLY